MKYIKWQVLFLILFGALNTNAQTSKLLLYEVNPVAIPDTVRLDTVIQQQFVLKNIDTNTFNDVIFIYSKVNGVISNDTIPGSGIFFRDTSYFLNPNDSAILNVTFNFNSPRFAAGPSVVVIWPVAIHGLPNDSITKMIFITPVASLNDPAFDKLKVFANGNQLYITCNEYGLLKQLNIYDQSGRIISTHEIGANTAVPLDAYSAGVYYAEITLTNNSRKTYRIFIAGR
jgi:hypothetical protein